MTPRVTVLMPVYNGMRYLREAVDSVFAQTLADFEFLIIDDASTDDTPAYLRSLTDPRVRVVTNDVNLGQTATLNKGLSLARGAFIARLDQDDVCLPERLERQLAVHDARPDVALSCTWEYTIDSLGRRRRIWRADIANYGELLGTLAVGKVPVWHPSVMFATEAVRAVGGYDESIVLAEDYDLWLKLALARHNAAVVSPVLLLQRDHDARQSITKADLQRENLVRSHQQKLVNRFCPEAQADAVGALLRMDDTFSTRRWGKETLLAVCGALAEMLERMSRDLNLTPGERASLAKTVYGRLGPGVRLDTLAPWLPSALFPAAFFALSPRLSPGVRRASSAAHTAMHELRHPIRAIASRVKGQGR